MTKTQISKADFLSLIENLRKSMSGEALKQAVEILAKSNDIIGDDGKPMEVDVAVLTKAVEPAPNAIDEGVIAKAVRDQIDAALKGFKPEVRITGGDTRNDDDGKWGFKSFGEYAQAVVKGSARNATPDARLFGKANADLHQKAPTTFGNESVGADGGFAVPPDFRTEIMTRIMGEDSLLALAKPIPVSGNSLTVPTDETTPWQTSGGILANWTGEGDQKSQSKPALTQKTVSLNKLAVLVPVTDELLEDAAGLNAYLPRMAAEKIDFKINLAIVQGTGVGQPLGILNSAGTVSVAKVSGQVADTIVALNIAAMWKRMYAPYRRNAIWIANQDIQDQLDFLMKVGKLDTGAADTGWGATGLFYNAEAQTLRGRPIFYTQAAETLGDKGDIILADMSQYLAITKAGGVKQDVSMHLYFDYDMTAFRWVLRMGGQPWWSSVIQPRDGTTTYGAFVTLDERA